MKHRVGVFLCVFLFLVSFGVDRNKFKKCNDAKFCERQKQFSGKADNEKNNYFVVPGTRALEQNGLSMVISNEPNEENHLRMKIHAVSDSIFRVVVHEESSKHPRYQVHDVLTSEGRKSQQLKQEADGSFKYRKSSFLQKDENVAEFTFRQEVNGEQINAVTFNAENLLYFESYKEKAEGENWSESFKSHTDDQPKGPASIGVDFGFPESENVFGIPSHASDFSLKNTKGGGNNAYDEPYRLFNLDVFEYELDETMALYGSIPYIVSHSSKITAGVFWLNSAETYVNVFDDSSPSGWFGGEVKHGKGVSFHSETGIIEAFIILGPTPKKVMQQYYHLTGYPQLPPLFSIAYHQCRWNYNDMVDVENVNNGYEENDIPYDVLWLDIEHTNGKRYFTWDKYTFPDPKKMIDDIASYGRKMVTIIDPHIKKDNNYHVYKDAHDKGLFVQNKDGSEYSGWCWPGTSAYLDFCRPEVREYWANLFHFDKYEGSTPALFTWNDMNEPSVFDGPEVSMPRTNLHYHGDLDQPWEHRDVHNLYGYYHQMATYEGHLKRAANTRPFVLSRAFFAGSQRYGAVWTGDNAASWDHLKASIPMLLSHSIAGLPFIGADVGGFFGNPDPELLWRWYQLGAFQPFFRAHAHKETARREPWLFGDDYTHKINIAVSERYQLLPYIYTLFYHSSKTGEPVNRPIWFEFPEDKNSFGRDDVFLLGDGLLVSCVSQAGLRGQQALLLPGTANDVWYNYYPPYAQYYGGSQGYADITNKIPVFIRGGSIISIRERKRRSSTQMKNDPITLIVAADKEGNATGTFYWDDGESLDHQTGNRELRKFTLKNQLFTNERVGPESFNSKAPAIERIILIGLPTSKAESRGRQLTLLTVQGAKIIRKPLISLNENWSIFLN